MNFFPGFETFTVDNAGVRLFCRAGGSKQAPPLLLMHGHPQTHVLWHLVAPELTKKFRVVMFDLRGYGDSDRPASDERHLTYSKRVMSTDALAVMQHLGYQRFQVLAHDRGARVAHRLAADHPEAIERLMLLDIAPTLAMYERTTQEFACAYWHWFFLIQPAPLPESMIASDPVRYIHSGMGSRYGGLAKFAPTALAEYERCVKIEGSAAAMCEDYRAAATIDLEHDRTDISLGKKLTMPVCVLWGKHGVIEKCFDPLALWRERAIDVSGRAVDSGHYIAEENPEALLAEVWKFFKY